MGAGEDFIDTIRNIYEDAETEFKTSSGLSTPRVAATGVRQGDPLSGVVFILTIDFLLRKIQHECSRRHLNNRDVFHHILAYADDMLVIAKSADDLQALLDILDKLASRILLKFDPKKCNTLHYSSNPPAGCRGRIFNLNDVDIPVIVDGDPAIFWINR